MVDILAYQFLLTIFERLDQEQIPYVVLRGIEKLPNLSPGKDVDIIVYEKDAQDCEQLLDKTCFEHEGLLVFREVFAGRRSSLYFFRNTGKEPVLVNIDLRVKVDYRGMILIPTEGILKNRRRWQSIWRPSYSYESAAMLFHEILERGYFEKDNFKKILEFREKAREGFTKILRSEISSRDVVWVEKCLDEGDFKDIVHRNRWIISLLFGHPSRAWALLWWQVSNVLHKFKLMLIRRGALIVILGPDGSGKTTLTDAVSLALESLSIKTIRLYFGVRTPLLPTKRLLQYLRKKRQVVISGLQVPAEPPNKKKQWPYFFGTIHTLIDQTLRYWVYARLPLARGRIVLCDRYHYDAVITPTPKGFYFIIDFAIRHLTPKPDLTIVLSNKSETIYRRKQELSIPEIDRQQNCYAKLFPAPFHAKEVFAGRSVEEIVLEILFEVMISFGKRNS